MKKKKAKHKSVLYWTVQLCWLEQREGRARNRLLSAMQGCTKKQKLNQVLLFGQFLQDEQTVQHSYHKRLLEIEQQEIA